MTAAEVADAVRRVKMDAGRAAVPKASSKERRAAQRLVAQFDERFGMDATMRIDKKRGVLRLEVKLSDLVGGVGPQSAWPPCKSTIHSARDGMKTPTRRG